MSTKAASSARTQCTLCFRMDPAGNWLPIYWVSNPAHFSIKIQNLLLVYSLINNAIWKITYLLILRLNNVFRPLSCFNYFICRFLFFCLFFFFFFFFLLFCFVFVFCLTSRKYFPLCFFFFFFFFDFSQVYLSLPVSKVKSRR